MKMSNESGITETQWMVGPFLIEKHQNGNCECSYCKSAKTGLVLPECRCCNAWRSIRWYWKDGYWVIRWTMPYWWPICQRCKLKMK